MWFYLYLLTTSFYDQMGFHMWGHTTNMNFSHHKLKHHVSIHHPAIYYNAVYRMPSKFIAFPFDKVIQPPNYYMVRDDAGWEWYKISTSHMESIFSNASIPFLKMDYKTSDNHSTSKSIWNHTEL